MRERQQRQPEARRELPERLDEFRTALEEEIASARSDAFNRGVSLVSGRRIAQVGSAFQYAFTLENSLSLPGDTPGDLHVPDHRRVEVTIVAIDGMSIVLSSPQDFGDYIARAQLVSDLTFLMRRLIERIEDLSASENPVGDRILSNSNRVGAPQSAIQPGLNPSQRAALESSLGRNLTFIWGPPGTGKTLTLGSVGYQLAERARSVLLVSHTNTAVDQAILRIADLADPESITNGKFLRVGAPHDMRLIDYPELLLDTHVSRRSERISNRIESLEDELRRIQLAVLALSKRLSLAEWYAVSVDDLADMRQILQELMQHEKSVQELQGQLSELTSQSNQWHQAKNDAALAKDTEAQIATLDSELSTVRQDLGGLKLMDQQLSRSIAEAEIILSEASSVNWMIRRWRGLPSPDAQNELLRSLEMESKNLDKSISAQTFKLEHLEKRRSQLGERYSEFLAKYSHEPDDVLKRELEYREQLVGTQEKLKELNKKVGTLRAAATNHFGERLEILRSMELVSDGFGSAESMFKSIDAAFSRARHLVGDVDIEQLRTDVGTANNRVVEIEREVDTLQDQLTHVRELLISEADVIATTLTRAYLNDSVRARRYDTLILDEASMAPLPAVWTAASLADQNAVVAGDPEQLPPIVISSKDMAKKWLGRDVFEVSQIRSKSHDNLVLLNTQYRMDPSIASISNDLIYGGLLRSSEDGRGQPSDNSWISEQWAHDPSVLLVDTGPLNAWVTSVPRGRNASRLNFLSASLCMDLCQLMLDPTRSDWIPGEPYRIFVECPYRPHANLLRILTTEYNLSTEVLVGTIHTFQGSEADVVLLDLVNDEPHWRVGLFIPENDRTNSRLLNVALTRARTKLIIVGDFDYIERLSRKAFIGRVLLPYLLERFPRVSALNVVPEGILARAAEATGLISTGEVESDASRIVVTQNNFYPHLISDINSANDRIVVYSPFLTRNRISELQAPLRSAVERGVVVYVVTKPLEERGKRQSSDYRKLEQTLEDWGIVLVHKRRMHEKLVFVDDSILWEGSLNPLSFSDTQEHMERRVSKTIVKQYEAILRLAELVGEYSSGTPKCPICGSETVASEGNDDPYYWRCIVDGCYSRSIDQPRIEDGRITCFNCGGDVEIGEWGDETVWRCLANRRHRQGIARTHLRLPSMRALIPEDKLRELDHKFGITEFDTDNVDLTGQIAFDV